MDVRCEKCSTVYEFDDSRVGAEGVTVKCTQCGNLFKVKRRGQTQETAMGAAAARSPAYIPPAKTPEPPPMRPASNGDSQGQRTTSPGIPVLGTAGTRPARAADSGGHRVAPAPAAAPKPADPPQVPGWMIRAAATGDVYRFRELTTLQQWIVERKVTRDDEISRSGEAWRRLGDIAELESFFHVVEQAAAVARADGPLAAAQAASAAYHQHNVASPAEDDPALSTTAPMTQPTGPTGPTALGNLIHHDEPAFARSRSSSARMAAVPDDIDDEFDRPPRRRGLAVGLLAVGVLVAAGGYLVMFKRDAVSGLFSHGNAHADEAYRQGREYFLLDNDDNFRQAVAAFERAHDENPKAALPLAGLAEAKAQWAGYLRDDARALETGTGSPTTATAAKTLRREAQAHLDDAKRAATEALDVQPESPEVNRAMAAYLLVDGAPAPEVQRYLGRATEKRAADAESAFVDGALAYRDGKLDDARAKLTQANALNQAATQHALLRASYLLARILVAKGDKEGAKAALQTVLQANAQHDRARALLASLEGTGTTTAPSGASTAATGVAAAPTGAAVAPTGASANPTPPGSGTSAAATAPKGHGEPEASGADYGKLVAQGDRLSENGRAAQARKLYERALSVNPSGVEAITGLGYCDLDGEKFSSAVDHFKQALAIAPGNGEAIIGLAEAYKLRGDKQQAIEWYKKYLAAQPNGPKATMAKNNVRDLEPQKREVETTTVPATDTTAKAPNDTPPVDNKDDKPAPLPRLPTNDEPPP